MNLWRGRPEEGGAETDYYLYVPTVRTLILFTSTSTLACFLGGSREGDRWMTSSTLYAFFCTIRCLFYNVLRAMNVPFDFAYGQYEGPDQVICFVQGKWPQFSH